MISFGVFFLSALFCVLQIFYTLHITFSQLLVVSRPQIDYEHSRSSPIDCEPHTYASMPNMFLVLTFVWCLIVLWDVRLSNVHFCSCLISFLYSVVLLLCSCSVAWSLRLGRCARRGQAVQAGIYLVCSWVYPVRTIWFTMLSLNETCHPPCSNLEPQTSTESAFLEHLKPYIKMLPAVAVQPHYATNMLKLVLHGWLRPQ